MDETAPTPQTQNPVIPAHNVTPTGPLPIEEIPEVPVSPQPQSIPPPIATTPVPSETVQKRGGGSCSKAFGIVILFVILFLLGMWLSGYVREFFPSVLPKAPSPTSSQTPTPTISVDPYASWKSYEIMNGMTQTAIAGLRFKLPEDVLSPICDGANCVSQGTYLPGGTRLTVAARGPGQVLRDYRGAVISDANGTPMTTNPLSLLNFSAVEFTSSGSGRTLSGYVFSQMRGVMIPISDTASVEINHFTPTGIVADFTADDSLFDSILKTFSYTAETPTPSPTSTVLLFASPTATTTGY